MNILTVKNLSHHYADGDQNREVLKDINYKFDLGKLYTIAGPSGSGKTTFLSIIAGLDVQCSGEVIANGKTLKKSKLTKYRQKEVSIVFQSYNLITYLTALENVILSMEISGDITNKKAIATEKLLEVGLDEQKINRLVSTLSGGEQQRVAIARSLATNPELILADEPTGNLDTKTEKEIIKLFKELATKKNKCVIVVTHSSALEKEADVNIKLNDGKFVGE